MKPHDAASAVIRRAHLAGASGVSGVPATTAAALLERLPDEIVAAGLDLGSQVGWTSLVATVLLEAGQEEPALRALSGAGACDAAGLDVLERFVRALPSAAPRLVVEEPASDRPASVTWLASVSAAARDLPEFLGTLGVAAEPLDALRARIDDLGLDLVHAVGPTVAPGAPPGWVVGLSQVFDSASRTRRIEAMLACATAMGVSERQRRWFARTLEALATGPTTAAPVTLRLGAAGVEPVLRVSLASVPEAGVLRLVTQFGDESDTARLGRFAALGGPEGFTSLDVDLRPTEPPGIGFSVST